MVQTPEQGWNCCARSIKPPEKEAFKCSACRIIIKGICHHLTEPSAPHASTLPLWCVVFEIQVCCHEHLRQLQYKRTLKMIKMMAASRHVSWPAAWCVLIDQRPIYCQNWWDIERSTWGKVIVCNAIHCVLSLWLTSICFVSNICTPGRMESLLVTKAAHSTGTSFFVMLTLSSDVGRIVNGF